MSGGEPRPELRIRDGLVILNPLVDQPSPADYAAQLRAAVLGAERLVDEEPDNGYRSGYAMGLRVAAGLYGLVEGSDPHTRRTHRARWELRKEATGGGPCGRCRRPFYTHVCLSCSPDAQTPSTGGCHNCRYTGFDQTPCLPPAGPDPTAGSV